MNHVKMSDARKQQLNQIFARELRSIFEAVSDCFDEIQEIRLRVNAPLMIIYRHKEIFLTAGRKNDSGCVQGAFNQPCPISGKQWNISAVIRCMPMKTKSDRDLSLFRAVIAWELPEKLFWKDGKIKNIKYISFINVRLAHRLKAVLTRLCLILKRTIRFFIHSLYRRQDVERQHYFGILCVRFLQALRG